VQAGIQSSKELESLLVKRVLSELYSLIKSIHSAILHNTYQLFSQLASRITSQEATQLQHFQQLLYIKVVISNLLTAMPNLSNIFASAVLPTALALAASIKRQVQKQKLELKPAV
jgi:hypothetical protein